VINQKGGVGKTATAYNVSYSLSQLGKKTLLVDMDPSRNATKPYCEEVDKDKCIISVLTDKSYDPRKAIFPAQSDAGTLENLFILPSHVSLAIFQKVISGIAHKEKLLLKQLEKVRYEYDYIFVDCPPMLSEFSIIALYAADWIIVPLKYETDAIEGIGDLFAAISEVKEDQEFDIRILRNGLDFRKKDIIAKIDPVLEPFVKEGKVFTTIIRQDEDINKAKAEQLPLALFSPKSRGAMDYAELTKEILNV